MNKNLDDQDLVNLYTAKQTKLISEYIGRILLLESQKEIAESKNARLADQNEALNAENAGLRNNINRLTETLADEKEIYVKGEGEDPSGFSECEDNEDGF